MNSAYIQNDAEKCVIEYNDDLLLIRLDGLWYPCLQRKAVRGKTRKFQKLIYGWKHPQVCAKKSKYRAERIAFHYARGYAMVYADQHTSYLPLSYAMRLAALQGVESDEQFLERMQNGSGEV